MAKILRGDIVWADLNPTQGSEQSGKRPVVVLSHDIFNLKSGTVIAVALTSQPQKAGFPLTLELKGDSNENGSITTDFFIWKHNQYTRPCIVCISIIINILCEDTITKYRPLVIIFGKMWFNMSKNNWIGLTDIL